MIKKFKKKSVPLTRKYWIIFLIRDYDLYKLFVYVIWIKNIYLIDMIHKKKDTLRSNFTKLISYIFNIS